MVCPCRAWRAVLVAAAVALSPVPVAAAPDGVPVEIEGDVPDFWRDQIAAAIERSLADGERRASVHVRLVAEARVYTLEVTATDPTTGERLESREECPLCGLAEVVEMAARQSRVLVGKLERRAAAVGWVTVETRPPGADITVDGEPRGHTPATLALPPGPHDVAVSRRGYNSTQRRVTAVADVRETWSLDLVRREQRDDKARAFTIAGGVLVGVAAPALVAGSTLLALDGKPYRRRCSGGDVDPQGDCRFRFASNVHGGVLVGIAAALAIGGIVLLTQAKRPARSTRARATMQAGALEVRF